MFCASTTVIYQSNAIHTGNDKHAPYVIPLYQLVPEPLCIRHRDARLTSNYFYLYDTGVRIYQYEKMQTYELGINI